MELTISLRLPDSVSKEAADKKQTIHSYVASNIQQYLKATGDSIFRITDKTEPVVQIAIDLHGILRVVGGVSIQYKDKKINLILVDEGASYLLFRLTGKEAVFQGGFNGSELKRFWETNEGSYFSYYRRVYYKLSMETVRKLVNPGIVYFYNTDVGLGDPRKVQ